MIIITQPHATEAQIERIIARVREFGLDVQINRGASRVIICVIGSAELAKEKPLAAMPGVEAVYSGADLIADDIGTLPTLLVFMRPGALRPRKPLEFPRHR